MSSASIISTDTNSEEEADCLKQLKVLVKGCDYLNSLSPIIDDKFLLHFVRGKKYQADLAFTTLQNYINIRKDKYKEIFYSLKPSEAQIILRGIIKILKNRDPMGRVIFVVDFGLWDASEVSIDELCQGLILYIEEAWNLEEVEKHGVIGIFDTSRFSFQHLRMFTPRQLQKCISIFWQNVPIRSKAVYCLNAVGICSLAYKVVRPFLPEKLRERLKIMSRNDGAGGLYEDISPDILPESLGGTCPEEETWDEEIKERVLQKDEYYEFFTNTLRGPELTTTLQADLQAEH